MESGEKLSLEQTGRFWEPAEGYTSRRGAAELYEWVNQTSRGQDYGRLKRVSKECGPTSRR